MAFQFFVLPASATLAVQGGATAVDASPLRQVPGSVVDTNRINWSPGTSANGWWFELDVTMPTVTQDHGGITQVEVLARMFRSGLGPDKWQLDEQPFVALGGDIDKDGLFGDDLSHWFLPGWHRYEGYTIWCGVGMNDYYWNQNTQSSPLAVYQWDFDITSRRTWDNAALSGMKFRLSARQQQQLGGSGYYRAGWNRGGGGNTPRWNCSQFILRVTANDPPIPYASGNYFLGG